jgi:hypothetical protein
VDDGWWCHPKVMGQSLAAKGLWISALSWSCQQRRSLVPETFVSMMGAGPDEVAELIAAGVWIEAVGGWEIHNWSEYQERSVSEKRADAGRKGGSASSVKHSNDTTGTPSGQANGKQTEANGSKPEASGQANGKQTGKQESLPDPTHTQTQDQDQTLLADSTALALVPEPGPPAKPAQSKYPDAFEHWWSIYPRREGKGAAFEAWKRARGKVGATRLVDAARAHADAWQRHGYEAQFIPQPRTWLAQARWDDELPGPRAGPAVASRTTRNHQRLAASLARMQGAQA